MGRQAISRRNAMMAGGAMKAGLAVARLDRLVAAVPFSWKFWALDWGSPASGEHTVSSRAIDTAGNVQPAKSDPVIANKRTYWESNGQITRRVQIT